MADNNWNAFNTSESGNNQNGDDDWADFGGFESASPASNIFGDSSASGTIPWATVFPATSSQQSNNSSVNSQPINSAVFNDGGDYAVLKSSATNIPSFQNNPSNSKIADPGQGFAPQSSSLGNQVTQDFSSKIDSQLQTSLVQAQPSEISSIKQKVSAEGPPLPQRTEFSLNEVLMTSSNVQVSQSAPPLPSRQKTGDSHSAVHEAELKNVKVELEETKSKVNDYEEKLQISEEKLSLAEREKIRLEKNMEEMKAKYTEATQLAKDQYLELQKQKEMYDQLQDEHEEKVKKLRKAGQESFALIVEEYKALSTTAVSQERERNEKHLHKILEEERDKFTEFIKHQGETLKIMVVEEQTKGLHKIEDALEEQKGKYEKKLNDCLEEERKKHKELLEKALEEERTRGVAAADELLLNQKKEFESMISSVKKQFEENLCQERKETKNLISKFVEEQKEEAKSNLNETMVEEREKSRHAAVVIKDQLKEEMKEYAKEKEKADEALRLRNYQSMDVFLQAIRTQLQSLMNNTEIDRT